jgi:hypothetical protein
MPTAISGLRGDDALDLLGQENLELKQLFGQVNQNLGSSVEERDDYGNAAKEIIKHVAIREAALVDVEGAISDVPELQTQLARFKSTRKARRSAIDRVEKMSRGVQGINLNTGQDFHRDLTELMQIVGTEIEWQLEEGIPTTEGVLEEADRQELKSAQHVARHAPTNIDPRGRRWRERAPVLSRFLTIYDRLRDFPKSVNARSRRPEST